MPARIRNVVDLPAPFGPSSRRPRRATRAARRRRWRFARRSAW
jgi:hypothetical protein